jgi:hypothetical protein
MSASAAMSRKKAAAGVTSKPTPQHAPKFGEVEDTPKEISPNQLLVQHDYKLHVFENKIKELHERTTFLSRNQNSEGGLSTVNENMLTEALQAMDQRLDNLEEGLTMMTKTNNTTSNTQLTQRLEKVEADQSELKALLLKIQGLAMETQMRMMQLRGNETTTTNTTVNSAQTLNNTPTFPTTEVETITEEESGKKSKKINNK